MIEWLQNWYMLQCDGNWEHDYGIRIYTLDNPGWNIEIDLHNTSVELKEVTWCLYEYNEKNWIGYKVENSVFIASCDPQKLNLMIFIFQELIEGRQISKDIMMSKLEIGF